LRGIEFPCRDIAVSYDQRYEGGLPVGAQPHRFGQQPPAQSPPLRSMTK
jgi:hypothetical protein